nr:MAG TPA: hypothetical protein [Caudoviricetes sp.]
MFAISSPPFRCIPAPLDSILHPQYLSVNTKVAKMHYFFVAFLQRCSIMYI